MKSLFAVIFVSLIPIFSVIAQESKTDAKLDTLITTQKKMADQQTKIYEEVAKYKEPLEGRTFGIEFNPAYFLSANNENNTVISGGFSLFDVDRNAEIAFPIFYGKINEDGGNDYTEFSVDASYRYFLGQHQDGFYVSGTLRYGYLKGEEGEDFVIDWNWNTPKEPKIVTNKRVGAMFGIGYRYFSYKRIYWGTSISYGSYFSDGKSIKGVLLGDSRTIFDFEILKFGFAF
ncbi:MAG: hypothetical protein J0L62_10720 [Bacteroidetes bacterium]|nr:hypothetical protein [Bacteroidota bacterium]